MQRTIAYAAALLSCCIFNTALPGQDRLQAKSEKIFAEYFDIRTGSPEGTEVTGRIHLERNKDVASRPIPATYHFEITRQDSSSMFSIGTRFDLSGRIMGVLSVADGKRTDAEPAVHSLGIVLKDGEIELERFEIKVRIVEETLWSLFSRRYTPETLRNKRLYGRIKYSDSEVAGKIDELKGNGWMFKGLEKCYRGRPQDYIDNFNPDNASLPAGTIEYDWEKVVNQIGGLGYSYATSKVYGPEGDPIRHKELKETLYQAILAYTSSVPVEGNDIMIDGNPIGTCTGDGFAMLQSHKLSGIQIPTHQWTLTDGLTVPVLHLMPDIAEGIQNGDSTCIKVHDALIRYMQIFFSEIKGRRAIDDKEGRWGEIQDTTYSAGAWADANLGHRSRTLLALPIIWADYNRPLTYVQYWYSDYWNDRPFKGFSYSPGWSPHGIVADVSRWMTKYNIAAHKYRQSGFQPDGTVSHHTGNATDAAMVAYGFEWLTACNDGYSYFKDTNFKIADQYCQFQADRLLNVYPKLFYRQRMDFLVAGRSFLGDMRQFVLETYCKAVHSMLKARSMDTEADGAEELERICSELKDNTYEYSGTDAYWVNEFLVHRRGEDGKPFYASLKLKSCRTVGAEDFNRKVRRSWHMGYGILPVKVRGDEYSENVLGNFDWHALPGLTEEWRTDPMPTGHSQASLPGLNRISGVLADGKAGMGIYHHLPKEEYSSATAFKSYHFIEDKIVSIGSGIERRRTGQQNDIVTFIDQTAHTEVLTYNTGKGIRAIDRGQSADITEEIGKVCWLHHGRKGYVILPESNLLLMIKSGKEVNVTDMKAADGKPNFIIAVSHGKKPGEKFDDSYCYIQIPDVNAEDMPRRVKALLKDLEFSSSAGTGHAIYSKEDRTWQYAFFRPGNLTAGGITVSSDDVAQIMLREEKDGWILSVSNPMPDGTKQQMAFTISGKLPEGTYPYRIKGLYTMDGETVKITSIGNGSRVEVELPDNRDAVKYNHQSELYAGSPIVIKLSRK